MKKILTVFLLVSSFCFGNYDEYLKKAEERLEKQSFLEAEEFISEAIKEKESAQNYYFRAKCYLGSMKLSAAIEDLDKAIQLDPNGYNVPLDEIYALKYNCMSFLKRPKEELDAVKEVWFNLPNVPKMVKTEDGLLISNIQSESQKSLFKFLHKSEKNDLIDLPNGDLLIKKKCNCGNGCCLKSISTKNYWSGCVGSCHWAFAGIEFALIVAASKFPDKASLIAMIAFATKHLEGMCIDCCEGADFKKDCVQPVKDQLNTLNDALGEIMWGDPKKTDKEYENLDDFLKDFG